MQSNPYENYKPALKPQNSLFVEKNLNKISNTLNLKHESTNHQIQKKKKFEVKEVRDEMNNLGLLDDSDFTDLNTSDDDEFLAKIDLTGYQNTNTNKSSNSKNNSKIMNNNRSNQDNSHRNRNIHSIKRQSSFSENLNRNLENLNKKPKSSDENYQNTFIKHEKTNYIIENDDDEDNLFLDFLATENSNQKEDIKVKEEKMSKQSLKPILLKENIETKQSSNYQIKQEPEPELINTIKIERLIEFLNNKTNCCIKSNFSCIHIIKGFIKTLTAPLNKINMKWYQKCLISDGSQHLECYIDDAITTDFMQITVKQAKELYQKTRESNDPKILNSYNEKLHTFSQRLAHFSGLIYLKYDNTKSEYCIVKLETPEDDYFKFLINRINKSGILK